MATTDIYNLPDSSGNLAFKVRSDKSCTVGGAFQCDGAAIITGALTQTGDLGAVNVNGSGTLKVGSLPTSLPAVTGVLWRSGTTLLVADGA